MRYIRFQYRIDRCHICSETYNPNAFIFQSGLQGLTGLIEFNEGKRSNFKLDLLKLKKEEVLKVGQWTPLGGINITDPAAFYDNLAPNITLVVMTREVSISDFHIHPKLSKL